MANETVLIVDGDAAGLRVAASVLRREGYNVQASSNAEQALTILRSGSVDLMLVNARQPGMSAAELVSQVRYDPRTANLIVVGMREPANRYSETVLTAIAGWLDKPLDPVELAQFVRHLLVSRVAPPVPPVAAGPSASDDHFRRAFAADGYRQSCDMLRDLGGSLDARQACETVRSLADTAHTLGFQEICERAADAAQALTFYPSHYAKLQGPLADLREAFERTVNEGLTHAAPDLSLPLRDCQIALIGFPQGDADRLCEGLARAGARVRLFGTNESPESASVRGCALCLVHVRPETAFSPWLRVARTPLARTVFAGRLEHLLSMDPELQFGAREFLVDGCRPEETVLRLARTLTAPAAAPEPVVAEAAPTRRHSGDVLIVDDDPNVRSLVKAVLENNGIRCRVAADGIEGVALAKEFAPAAALLDVNMPGMSGFEVLPKLRAASPATKVVMLTGREQEADIMQGFSLGTDDYVLKPFNPQELVARVRRLL